MVHVNNLESAESRVAKPAPSPDLSSEVMKMMPQGGGSSSHGDRAQKSEPKALTFESNIYGDCGVTKSMGKPMTQAEKDFKPDSNYSTQGGKEWLQKHKEQVAKPMELDNDGKYSVKPGDSLDSIAQRALKLEGKDPSKSEIAQRSKELHELNKDQFGNRDLIKPGMTLKIKPGAEDVSCTRESGPAGASSDELDREMSDVPGGGSGGSGGGSHRRLYYEQGTPEPIDVDEIERRGSGGVSGSGSGSDAFERDQYGKMTNRDVRGGGGGSGSGSGSFAFERDQNGNTTGSDVRGGNSSGSYTYESDRYGNPINHGLEGSCDNDGPSMRTLENNIPGAEGGRLMHADDVYQSSIPRASGGLSVFAPVERRGASW